MSNYQDMHGLVQLAATTPRQHSTSATPEQVELIVELEAVSRAITEHCRDVLQGQNGRWAELTNMLGAAVKACRRQTVIALDDEKGDPVGKPDAGL